MSQETQSNKSNNKNKSNKNNKNKNKSNKNNKEAEVKDLQAILRKKTFKERLDNNENIYKHKFDLKNRIPEILQKYSKVETFDKEIKIQTAGRILNIRILKNLSFIQLVENGEKIQILQTKDCLVENNETLKRGDIIGITGLMCRSKTNELSVKAQKIILLAPCLNTFPTQYYGLKDPELLYRKRYLDLILNDESRRRFILRSKIVTYLRNFLNNLDFVEVETPILDSKYGGATAKPFITYLNEMKLDMYLRISPELFHKTLIVGGLERVYEIGKVFRNEGVDLTHNPEFTSLEFYMAYADYNDLMKLTEDCLSQLSQHLFNSYEVEFSPEKREEESKEVVFNFEGPYRKIDMLDELNKCTNLGLTGLNLESKLGEMIDFCKSEDIKIEEPLTVSRVLDKMVGHFIEPQCVNPTFIINHPIIMSPLAKPHREKEGLTERFELFINGKEIANAYTELNDPFIQLKNFMNQIEDQKKGDEEAMCMDEGFVEALEYGMPPTGGFGFGIDRLVMFFSSAANIRDVILFPTLKPEVKKTSNN